MYFIEEVQNLGDKYDYVILLQPTQPLRESYHIDHSIELMLQEDKDGLVSICKVKDILF